MTIDNEAFRFGSASFAEAEDIRRAGLFKQTPQSVFLGFFEGKPLWYDGPGGLLLTAGARAGKFRDILAYNLCAGIHAPSLVMADMKGEGIVVSLNLTSDQKFIISWNPAGLHGLPQHHIHVTDFARIESPTLVSDMKVTWENLIPKSGSAQAEFFEGRAQEYGEAISLTLTEKHGVLTLPDLYHTINLIPGNSDEWLDFAYDMSRSRFPIARRVEEEIAAARDNPSGGFQGIMGELFKSMACLSDPLLMASVSPPYDFSFADLCRSDQTYQVYLMPPAEFVQSWAPVIKLLFVAGMTYKARSPAAPRQTWILDECAQLSAFPMVPKLYSYGAGIGIRPWAIYQSTDQMRKTAQNGETIIPASAAVRSYFAIREIGSAAAVSRQLGAQTLEYDDELQQARARHAKREALSQMLSGGDPLNAGLAFAHHKEMSVHRSQQHRLLRTPDEVLNCPPDKQFLFVDGLAKPIYADRAPYWE